MTSTPVRELVASCPVPPPKISRPIAARELDAHHLRPFGFASDPTFDPMICAPRTALASFAVRRSHAFGDSRLDTSERANGRHGRQHPRDRQVVLAAPA